MSSRLHKIVCRFPEAGRAYQEFAEWAGFISSYERLGLSFSRLPWRRSTLALSLPQPGRFRLGLVITADQLDQFGEYGSAIAYPYVSTRVEIVAAKHTSDRVPSFNRRPGRIGHDW
jgi:hypothetical protein